MINCIAMGRSLRRNSNTAALNRETLQSNSYHKTINIVRTLDHLPVSIEIVLFTKSTSFVVLARSGAL